ncbi:MAG: lipocalin family protein [Melioribacteraceae bacterium]|nr:lipocalin family protein [Melioribacteraceae bacterium]MCF8356540.1 lipocalin family protein [Melioribacteraceae bacterium]MCF8395934.1 lipocalin family protein [Melioribacteraceae bacterium]MCF8421013.1 lipocalin family protein [Melioribacteraceae bacterium]
MKKNCYSLIYFLLLLFILFFSSCNKDDGVNDPNDSFNFIGTWKLVSMQFLGTPDGDVDVAASEETMIMYINFSDDGTYSISIHGFNNGMPYNENDSGTWSASNGNLTITNPDTTMNMTYDAIDAGNVKISLNSEFYSDGKIYPAVFSFTKYTGANYYLKFEFIESRYDGDGFVVLNSLDGSEVKAVSHFYGDDEVLFQYMETERATFSMIGLEERNGIRYVIITSDINAVAGTWRMSGRNTKYMGDVKLTINFPDNSYNYLNVAYDGGSYFTYANVSGTQMIPEFQAYRTHDGKFSVLAALYNSDGTNAYYKWLADQTFNTGTMNEYSLNADNPMVTQNITFSNYVDYITVDAITNYDDRITNSVYYYSPGNGVMNQSAVYASEDDFSSYQVYARYTSTDQVFRRTATRRASDPPTNVTLSSNSITASYNPDTKTVSDIVINGTADQIGTRWLYFNNEQGLYVYWDVYTLTTATIIKPPTLPDEFLEILNIDSWDVLDIWTVSILDYDTATDMDEIINMYFKTESPYYGKFNSQDRYDYRPNNALINSLSQEEIQKIDKEFDKMMR